VYSIFYLKCDCFCATRLFSFDSICGGLSTHKACGHPQILASATKIIFKQKRLLPWSRPTQLRRKK